MKRIVHLSSQHWANDPRIAYRQCRSLLERGYGVSYICHAGQEKPALKMAVYMVEVPNRKILDRLWVIKEIYTALNQYSADIYHFHDPELIPLGLLLRLFGNEVIYDVHEDVPKQIRSKYWIPRWMRPGIAQAVAWLEQLSARLFSAIVTATPAIAERFRQLNPRTVVVQNFPSPEEFAPQDEAGWDHRDCAVAYVGGISRERGIREMVEAMSLLPDWLRAELKLVGDFSPACVRDEVNHLPGWKRIEEYGYVDRTKVTEVLRRVRGGLVLLHPLPNYIESEPTKLFEYMSAGIPVIASDFPLWRQIIEDSGCGVLVDPLNVKAIAGAIEYVLTHPQQAEAMGRRGREAVKRWYNWASEERKLLALYEDLVGNA